MEVLVVFLPLLAFLIAGSIALFGGAPAVAAPAGHGHDHGHHDHNNHGHHNHDAHHAGDDHIHPAEEGDDHDEYGPVAGPPTYGYR